MLSLPERPGQRQTLLLLILAWLSTAAVWGQPSETTADNPQPQPLTVAVQPGELIGHEQIVRYFIKSGTNEFMFILPPNARSAGTSSETLVLSGTDGRYHVSFRILGTGPVDANPEKARSRREQALERYPGAQQTDEFTFNAAGHEGQGLQLRQNLPGVGDRLVKIVWIPGPAGVLEFVLNADAKKPATGTQALETILLTFLSNEKGKIQIIPHSDKS